ncbi:MAG: PDZ domain-containing protein [Hamadaea sp.]|uniref:S41 family peptidase n=1 Tax=Hamadaea sp. TaxID=2024425 RepID=UPI0017A5CFA5|nr:S41 family peptidase [Hamadaea sp.]NUT21366.1 PDZ domain-containing protein [Hamadaea sp.]
MKKSLRITLGVVATTALAAGLATVIHGPASSAEPAARPNACQAPTGPIGQPGTSGPAVPTTVTTIGQAYNCILDNYYRGPILDDRSLLVPAFAALTQELQRRGLDTAQATMPALTGKRDADWTRFRRAYDKIVAKLPDDIVRQAVAGATLQGMVSALDDNHAKWTRGQQRNLLGLKFSGLRPDGPDPAITSPVFVTSIAPGSAAAGSGIKPGDEVISVNGVPLILNGTVTYGVVAWLTAPTPGQSLEFTLRRPATGKTFTATVTPVDYPQQAPKVGVQLLSGDIAKLTIPGFYTGVADEALAAIAELRKTTTLRGLILDLRGNGGGVGAELARLLGAFVHDKTVSYWCDVRDHCTANKADVTVPLLNLPLAVLTDRTCASACDSFAGTVKDLHLGTLIGTRTAGLVSGPTLPYLLDDGSQLALPSQREVGANHEIIDTIGVAPDHLAPMTSADLSAGRDPAVAKALSLLK